MTGPSTYTARVGSIAHIPCTFTADKLPADPKYFAVLWYLEGKIILSYDDSVPSPDPRYSLDKARALYGIADLTISNAFVSDSGNYTCSVTYSYFQMDKEIRVEISARPHISILSKSVQRNTENTLTCMVSGFFPSDIDVTWYKDGEVLKNQLMGKPDKYDNGTYQVISTVTITPSDDDPNKTLSCRVQHVSLQEPLQENLQLSYQESSSHVVILWNVILVVVIIAGIIGIHLWQRQQIRDAERPINDYKYTSAPCVQESGRQVVDNTWSFKIMVKEEKLLSTIKSALSWSFKTGQVPDPEIGEITVPDLIAGKRAELSCKLYNYIGGEHKCSWYIKVKSTGDVIPANYDRRKHQTIGKDKTSDDKNTYIAYLTLVPVEISDDGSEFILNVNLPDCVIERSTGPIHVKGQLSDRDIGEITVPDLIVGTKAVLSCKLYNYIRGKHQCSWYVKMKSSGVLKDAKHVKKKLQSIEKDETSDDQNAFIAYLELSPVEKSDDGSEFILEVYLQGCVIQRSTGLIHVKVNPRLSLSPDKRKNELDVSIEEHKDQCTESSTAENSKPQSSEQERICEPDNETVKESIENKPQCPVTVKKEDNTDTVIAMDSSSSKLEPE